MQVEFNHTDRKGSDLLIAAERMAKFICGHSGYLYSFCDVLRKSSTWKITDYKDKLDPKMNIIRNKRKKSNTDEEYISVLENFYAVCKKDDDINDVRGMFPEQLLREICRNNIHSKVWRVSTGCTVKIDGNLVMYKDADSESSKKTVDIGAWLHAKQAGSFMEAKVAPGTFQSVDKEYLDLLRDELKKDTNVKYKIFIFAMDNVDLVLEKICLSGYDLGVDTVILGRDNIFTTDILPLSA
jgi:hypothetical protein